MRIIALLHELERTRDTPIATPSHTWTLFSKAPAIRFAAYSGASMRRSSHSFRTEPVQMPSALINGA
jgi:hypothetical protein